MTEFQLPKDLLFNKSLIQDPTTYAAQTGSASWLFLVGDEFASMPNGMSYDQVRAAVPESARVVSDPPRTMNLELARQHVAALDALQRPTLISCRSGPRASAVAYMYAGLKAGARSEEVLARAEQDGAPFCVFPELRQWVETSMEALEKSGSSETTL
jgi:hypothetical protein